MKYTLRGRLCGYICADCREWLSDVVVRIYRAEGDQIVSRAAASPKETFGIVAEDDASKKKKRLLAEAKTDEEGRFTIELERGYEGGAVEVDVYCATVPRRKPTRSEPEPLQFSITTLQPAWRGRDELFASWEYCIPWRYWCAIRARFDAWTICGHVAVCDLKRPLGGVRVKAFDVDWLQDDFLGQDITDASGHFRIDYTGSDFRQTIFPGVHIEWFGGPDLYFRVETLAGSPLLVEPPSRGRAPDRENVGPCFCVELCVPKDANPDPNEPLPVFDAIGGYKYATEIDSAPGGSGLTSDNRAFFSTMRLNGILPKRLGGAALEYMFEWREVNAAGAPITAWAQVTQAQIARTDIGTWQQWAPTGPADPNPIKTKRYTVRGTAGPNELVASFTADGWIRVPQESDVFGASGFFQPNGNMINLISPSIVAWPAINLAGLVAGSDSTSTGQPLAQDRFFSLRMQVRSSAVSATVGGICQQVAIDNVLYDNLSHHPMWNPFTQSGALGVALLDIAELAAEGCAKITNALTVRFTAAHPNLGGVTVSMTGPSGTLNFTLPAAVAGQRFGVATPSGFVVADLPKCAYVVHLSVGLLLTTGDSSPLPLEDFIAFCK